MDSSGFVFLQRVLSMEWKNANKILPERGHRVLCLYPNGKMDVQLYLGRESFVHDLYGRCIFWTELPKRPKAYFKLMGRNE